MLRKQKRIRGVQNMVMLLNKSGRTSETGSGEKSDVSSESQYLAFISSHGIHKGSDHPKKHHNTWEVAGHAVHGHMGGRLEVLWFPLSWCQVAPPWYMCSKLSVLSHLLQRFFLSPIWNGLLVWLNTEDLNFSQNIF
ncbi:hypothetical protein B566_EDAN007877 [Ephemera danica]|nr:hypothetical protein B566_EDAN007877 [Ephemera danica]